MGIKEKTMVLHFVHSKHLFPSNAVLVMRDTRFPSRCLLPAPSSPPSPTAATAISTSATPSPPSVVTAAPATVVASRLAAPSTSEAALLTFLLFADNVDDLIWDSEVFDLCEEGSMFCI